MGKWLDRARSTGQIERLMAHFEAKAAEDEVFRNDPDAVTAYENLEIGATVNEVISEGGKVIFQDKQGHSSQYIPRRLDSIPLPEESEGKLKPGLDFDKLLPWKRKN
jgi:hypothetical protein